MAAKDKQIELRDKVLKGLQEVYEKLVELKKNSELVIMEGDKIVKTRPK